ncbi:low molecular weight phosphatase family protein [Mycolicibacterium sp. J2]|uniref:arsenate reductase/protein-tyrosine-phosphatase family protein n=1 Tax=Mycolicibacterium sp. J2 TaxID=2993511 RepID=UPI00224A6D87|nr:low molecular weight phosphatase family protein [Mycolicibacterium sp. J2]MCX2715900.1 low molecular weight phosphatase family protein [Mycolicibacterium sp. J2]
MGVDLHVLFICTGNICRSPTAERLAVALGVERRIHNFAASSAGTRAVIGHAMHPEAAQVLRNLGGDPSGFAARQLTPAIAGGADLVLTMTRAHLDTVLEYAPRQFRKTFTLSEAALMATQNAPCSVADLAALRAGRAEPAADVPDPIGQNPQMYAEVGSQIARLLPPIIGMCERIAAAGD